MSDAYKAYVAARRLIAEAKAEGLERLILDKEEIRALTRLPPEIADLDRLRVLDLHGTGVTDLSPLSRLSGLTMLSLDGTGVTDLSPLSGLTGLTTLSLSGTGVTDLSPISGLSGLTTLSLNDTGVTDLSPLSGLSGLMTLRLDGTGVTDLSPLSGLTGLTQLYLDATGVTDLLPLSGLTGLKTLELDNSAALDLRPLRGLEALTRKPENSQIWGLSFKNSAAARADPRIAEIADIKDRAERARMLFKYLDGWEPHVGGSEPGKLQGKDEDASPLDYSRQKISGVNERIVSVAARATSLQQEVGTLDNRVRKTFAAVDELSKSLEAAQERQSAAESETKAALDKFRRDIKETSEAAAKSVAEKMEAAIASFHESQAIKAPVELWKAKQAEHEDSARSYSRWFRGGLVVAVLATLGTVAALLLNPTALDQVLAPVGCDPTQPQTCQGFSLRGLIVTGGILTAFTVLLWFTRLQMKLYLAERHLALDARERQAFSQTYIGFLAEEGATEDAKDQRALVYSALFRPSSDGTVREDGGLDPSLSAAISKLLSK